MCGDRDADEEAQKRPDQMCRDRDTDEETQKRKRKGTGMKQLTVTQREAGQRLDKLLARYLNEAPKSFLYKMMRKKNITLNGKRAQGNELVQPGDEIRLFLADETVEKFQSGAARTPRQPLEILYEDEHILLVNKPVGMLSQKARRQDVSLVEYLTAYLLESGALTKEDLALFSPAVCNRLDRNTSGIVIAGKTLLGLQTMSRLLKERAIRKFYRCIVAGELREGRYLKGYLSKDTARNLVSVSEHAASGSLPIETEYRPLAAGEGWTLLEVHLITGRSHQIRAHLASIGHPILGDPKYGDERLNQRCRASFGTDAQLLHAYRLEFPAVDGALAYLSRREFVAPMPKRFWKILRSGKTESELARLC